VTRQDVPPEDPPGHSGVQQDAEAVALAALSETLGLTLTPTRIDLRDGTHVRVDGASGDCQVLVEAWAHQGPPRGSQPKKIATDAMKLAHLAAVLPGSPRLVLLFTDEAAAAPFQPTSGGWLAAAIARLNVEIHVVDLGAERAGDPGRAGTSVSVGGHRLVALSRQGPGDAVHMSASHTRRPTDRGLG